MMKRFSHPSSLFFAAMLVLGSASAFAVSVNTLQGQIDSILGRSSVSGYTWGVLIQNVSGNITYYSRNASTPLRPASNTKIFTTAGAFGLLGPGYVYQGQTMQTYCMTTNVYSDNDMADSLLKQIGQVKRGSFSFSAGAAEVIAWCNSIGVSMSGAAMYDGSGLNYDNRFSAAQIIALERYMMNNYSTYMNTMAVGCVSGTLASRFCGTAGSGNVKAKTGTLTNGQTIALSGFIQNTNDGQKYMFSFIANGATDTEAARQAIDDAVVVMAQAAIPNDVSSSTQVIVDNGYGSYSETGSWGASASAGYFGGGSRYIATGATGAANFTPSITSPGVYNVYAWWVQGSNRATNAVYQVVHANGTSNVAANQSINGGQWNLLGTYTFNSGTAGKVVLTTQGTTGKVVSSDAVRFVYSAPASVIVDNTSTGFAASTNWFASTSTAGYYGTNYHARATASVSDPATWSATLSQSGSYKVYARWTAGSNRAASAPYVVLHSTGSTTVNVNQQQNNGTWVLLGTFNLNAGTAERVKLSCWTTAGYYVIADAVKFDKQ